MQKVFIKFIRDERKAFVVNRRLFRDKNLADALG